MGFDTFVEGPLLWFAFLVLILGIATRIIFFLIALIHRDRRKDGPRKSLFAIVGRSLVPFHMGTIKRPFYACLRYVFHICLLVVPIWLAGHVVLWSESRFGWEWTTLPDQWADWMTISLLCLLAYFVIRRILVKELRQNSSLSDFILLTVATMPFLSGYLLSHGTLDSIPFFESHIRTIHVLSGEAMLLVTAFLFYRARLDREKCTGCAACVTSCPTGTLESKDEGKMRRFFYSLYLCICCGTCVKTCPEEAAALKHEISIRNFGRLFSQENLRNVELALCEGCGALFAPEPLLEKVAETIVDDYGRYCSTCKKTKLASNFYKLAPWPKGIEDPSKVGSVPAGSGSG